MRFAALKVMSDLLTNVSLSEIATTFYQRFYIDILQHMFAVATDTTHYSGIIARSPI